MAQLCFVSAWLLLTNLHGSVGQECGLPVGNKDTVAVTLDIDAKVNAGTEDKHILLNLAGEYRPRSLAREFSPDAEGVYAKRLGGEEWFLALKYVQQEADADSATVTSIDNLANKWTLISRTFFGISRNHSHCTTLSKDQCPQDSECIWKNSTCDALPWKTVAVCESGCPPPLNSTGGPVVGPIEGGSWPKSGSFPAKWRILAPAGNGDSIVESNIVDGDGSCCKRKPDVCDAVTDKSCPGLPIIGCILPDKNDCCISLTRDFGPPYCGKRGRPNVCDHSPTDLQATNALESTTLV